MRGALRLTEAELLNIQKRVSGVRSLTDMRDKPVERKKRDKKYGNTMVTDGALKFDSKAEHKRWQFLVMMEKGKEIKSLRLQVPYELIPAQTTPSGKSVRPTVYVADFVYVTKGGKTIVEDVKGAVTPEFRLKRKLMLERHGIEIQEVRS